MKIKIVEASELSPKTLRAEDYVAPGHKMFLMDIRKKSTKTLTRLRDTLRNAISEPQRDLRLMEVEKLLTARWVRTGCKNILAKHMGPAHAPGEE